MDRQYYLDLAAHELKMPIATDLVLHEQDDPQAILLDGQRLGHVLAEAARRYQTPLALPVMNLELEKEHLLHLLGIEEDPATYHFSSAPGPAIAAQLQQQLSEPLSAPMQAVCEALSTLREETDLQPVGMCIGPFSLMTKLVSDPITPIAMAGMGLTADEEASIGLVEEVIALSTALLERYLRAQAAAGAKAVVICEPAANVVYLSPNQIERGADIFERFVMQPLLGLREVLRELDVDLIFHDCGELTDHMVSEFVRLDPALLSLGSSRILWEDARLLPKDIVLYGNLPSKRFYSDREMTVAQVQEGGLELLRRMREAGHPFILGSECDILSVPGAEQTLREKALAIVTCGAPQPLSGCCSSEVAWQSAASS